MAELKLGPPKHLCLRLAEEKSGNARAMARLRARPWRRFAPAIYVGAAHAGEFEQLPAGQKWAAAYAVEAEGEEKRAIELLEK